MRTPFEYNVVLCWDYTVSRSRNYGCFTFTNRINIVYRINEIVLEIIQLFYLYDYIVFHIHNNNNPIDHNNNLSMKWDDQIERNLQINDITTQDKK